ncbi:hypothetical protein [Streptomyces malaysiensis]|uniref:ABM domain-containing protein n=1 Tax=Streptomyces malaysiensis subsp. samsunensis TaxID=459658 RepID=A0A9X2LZ47_STRMQ|nr:hypothetical protein [Streptomyces samsunensis]MCQ8832178.1 hypothetical protein [Streptomyces samsunensis]
MLTTAEQRGSSPTQRERNRLIDSPPEGFRSATFYLDVTHPMIYEHVVWETEEHFAAAQQHPSFVQHLSKVSALATATWTSLRAAPE